MKSRAIVILIIGILLGAGGTYLLLRKASPGGTTLQEGAQQLYSCGMHPQVISDKPGNCPICGMALTPIRGTAQSAETAQPADAKKERKILYWRAPMDPTEIYDRPGKSKMGMDLVPVYEGDEAGGSGGVQIDGRIRQNMNLRTAPVERRDLSRTIRAQGQITYAQDRESALNAKIHGWIDKLFVNTAGQQVRKGDPLLEIYSPELVTTQEEYLLALRNRDELASSPYENVRDGAERTLAAAKKRLELWDVPADEIAKLTETKTARRTLVLRAAASGIVTHKAVVEGDEVKPGQDLFHIADLGKVWVEAAVYESDLAEVREGMKAEVRLDQIPGAAFEGRVDFVYPYLDRKSRANNIRIVVGNPGGRLKPDMYATVSIQSPGGRGVLAVPSEAVLDSGVRKIVFVSQGEGLFEPREIRTGLESSDGFLEVTSGLLDGERVVVSGQFLLDSESRTREAIAKMRSAVSGQTAAETAGAMEGMEGKTDTGGGQEDAAAATRPAVDPEKLFACPMHPDFITTDRDARCPDCGMAVVPLKEIKEKVDLDKVQFYTCEMHPEFLTTDPKGRCPICGMNVVKVKK
jgi:RND family efflux transporter MFP subunit